MSDEQAPMPSTVPPAGGFGHGLPVTPPPRRRRTALIASIIALVVLAGVAVTVVLLIRGSEPALSWTTVDLAGRPDAAEFTSIARSVGRW